MLLTVNKFKIWLQNYRLDCWSKVRIHNQDNHFRDHFGDDLDHIFVRCPQIGVCIDFDQPASEILVHQKVETKKFKALLATVWIHFIAH
jgi:hypothetical protein